MKLDGPLLDCHLFVCTNTKDVGESCGKKDSALLRDNLKEWAAKAHPEWRGRVRVNASGCLGHCKRGIAAVMYPQGHWFTELKKDDDAVLREALESSMNSVAKRSMEPVPEKTPNEN